jgi:hypothetical protein
MADIPTAPTPDPKEARRSGVATSLIFDMADTTWRMFVPTVGLLLIGRAVDRHFGTKPWYMFAGITLGVVIATLLVKRQLTDEERKAH